MISSELIEALRTKGLTYEKALDWLRSSRMDEQTRKAYYVIEAYVDALEEMGCSLAVESRMMKEKVIKNKPLENNDEYKSPIYEYL